LHQASGSLLFFPWWHLPFLNSQPLEFVLFPGADRSLSRSQGQLASARSWHYEHLAGRKRRLVTFCLSTEPACGQRAEK